MGRLVHAAVAGALLLGVIGCGGDDEGAGPEEPAAPATVDRSSPSATDVPETTVPERPAGPRYRRTAKSLVACLRTKAVAEARLQGSDGEDAQFFSDLAGERVDVVNVTIAGEQGDQIVALFGSTSRAKRAEPSAKAEGFTTRVRGAALIVAPERGDLGAVERCLEVTGYASG